MNAGTTVFSQLMEFLPPYEFRLCVDRYHGNFKVKSFSCWDQFLSMAFAQLTYRESLRDIEKCLRAARGKLYHMEIRCKVSRNTFAHANEVRDWRIYRDFALLLIPKREKTLSQRTFGCATRSNHLCLGFHRHRSVPVALPLGEVSQTQGSRKASHPSGLTGQHPHYRDCHCGNGPRRKHHRRAVSGAWRNLCDGSWIRGLFSALSHPPRFGLLCHTSQKKFPLPASFTPTESTNPRVFAAIKPWRFAASTPKRIIPKNCAASVIKTNNQQGSGFPDQQLHLTGSHHRPTVSMPLAGGVILQMDQAASAYQVLSMTPAKMPSRHKFGSPSRSTYW